MTLLDLPTTDHEHLTTSTVVEIVLVVIFGTETCLYKLHNSENDYLIFPALKQESTSIAQPQPPQDPHDSENNFI